MIEVKTEGDSKKTERYLKSLTKEHLFSDLNRYGEMGVDALSKATPIDTGRAKHSWGYRVLKKKAGFEIQWYNTDIEGGSSVVILIQYGHATRGRSYISGHDFINPAIQPVFDQISDDIRKKVRS